MYTIKVIFNLRKTITIIIVIRVYVQITHIILPIGYIVWVTIGIPTLVIFIADNSVCQRAPDVELYSINSFPI